MFDNKQLLNNNYDYFLKIDNYGDNILHKLAKNSNINLIKQIVQKYNDLINITNTNNETILHILYNNYDFLNWSTTIKCTDYNIVDKHFNTILIKNILQTKTKNDNNYNIIKLLINKCNLTIPQEYPPLFIATHNNKYHIVKLLLKYNCDPDIKNANYITPLITACDNNYTDIVTLLLNHKADINYSGPMNNSNPIDKIIINNNSNLFNIIIKHTKNIDWNKLNKNNETRLHTALIHNTNADIIGKLLYFSDINIKNIKNITPLYLLLIDNKWQNYTEFFKTKTINDFDFNTKILKDIKIENINLFIEKIITPKYTACKNIKKQKCIALIKKYIFNKKNNKEKLKNKIKLIEGIKTYIGNFHPDIVHNMIYTIYLLKKYKNLSIPSQYYTKDKYTNDRLNLYNSYKYNEEANYDIISCYYTYFYEITPYLIVWKNRNEYYIHEDLDFYIKSCLENTKIRIIFLKITLVISNSSAHANILIYDKVKNTLERFEPYGQVPYLESEILDKKLEQLFSKIINNKIKYYSPKDIYANNIGLQTLSKDDISYYKKIGDPNGFCLVFCIFYLEERLNNLDVEPNKLLEEINNKILDRNTKYTKNVYIEYIRNYATVLTKAKYKMYKKVGIPQTYYNDYILPINYQTKLIDYLITEFNKIV